MTVKGSRNGQPTIGLVLLIGLLVIVAHLRALRQDTKGDVEVFGGRGHTTIGVRHLNLNEHRVLLHLGEERRQPARHIQHGRLLSRGLLRGERA